MIDWATIAELGTAAGTLILAVATFASVRSGSRTARAAERSLLAAIRPLLLPTYLHDPEEKIGFQDNHWMRVAGSHAAAEVTDDAVYLAVGLRNVGTGLAVLNGWAFTDEHLVGPADRPDTGNFRRLTRDLYVPANDIGFWQGAFRDPADPLFQRARISIRDRRAFTVDLLYSDSEGGQRMISRFAVLPVTEDGWLAAVSHHWNVDRPEPRLTPHP